MTASLTALEAGTVFAGDFRIEGLLGRGGMGSVYLAEQLSTGRRRALKLMSPALVTDEKSRERFVLEAKVGGRVESDHVVEVIGAGVDDATGMPWLAMELLEGETLADHVASRGALPPAEVREIFEQLGHALGAAHGAGLVHRDIKPENLFLAAPRRAGVPFTLKVLDFGLAKVLEEASLKGGTTEAMGSPLWMAPEQTGKAKVGPPTDVWALGLLAYYLLTGHHFWKAASSDGGGVKALLVEILVDPIGSASESAPEGLASRLPDGFDDWFSRCVARDPEERFADASAAVGKLVSLLGGGAVSATASVSYEPVSKSSQPAAALAETAPSAPGPAAEDLAFDRTAPSGPAAESPAPPLGPSEAPSVSPALSPTERAPARLTSMAVGIVVLVLVLLGGALGLGLILGRRRAPDDGLSRHATAPGHAPADAGSAARGKASSRDDADGASAQAGGASPDAAAESATAPTPPSKTPAAQGPDRLTPEAPAAHLRPLARPPPRLSPANKRAAGRVRALATYCWVNNGDVLPERRVLRFPVTIRFLPGGQAASVPARAGIRGTRFARCLVAGVSGRIRFEEPEDGSPVVFMVKVQR